MESWFHERSKYEYYDENEDNGENRYTPPNTEWHDVILGFPLLLVIMVLVVVGDLLIAAYGFYQVAKTTYERGEPEYPKLTIIGIFLTGILAIAHLEVGFEFRDHPVITACSGIFILYATLAPLTGLCLLFFKLLLHPDNKGESHE